MASEQVFCSAWHVVASSREKTYLSPVLKKGPVFINKACRFQMVSKSSSIFGVFVCDLVYSLSDHI